MRNAKAMIGVKIRNEGAATAKSSVWAQVVGWMQALEEGAVPRDKKTTAGRTSLTHSPSHYLMTSYLTGVLNRSGAFIVDSSEERLKKRGKARFFQNTEESIRDSHSGEHTRNP